MSKFWSPFVKDLVPYVPGEQPKLSRLVKLNTNENPYGPSPQALAAMQAELNDDLRLYPDPNGERLKQAVAAHYGVQANQVFVGNGSDEVLAHIFHGLFQHDLPLLFPDVTYSFYPVYCGLYGIAHEKIALDERFRIRVEDYARPNGGIIFPNPNAPTGCLLPLDAIEAMLKASPDSVVVVDEAYVDFGGESAIALVDRYPNLLVTQTLSKSRSWPACGSAWRSAMPIWSRRWSGSRTASIPTRWIAWRSPARRRLSRTTLISVGPARQ